MPELLSEAIAAEAARLVVETGMEYGPAKAKAARTLGRRAGGRGDMPSNEQVEDAVREHLSVFCADTQPAELAAMRQVAAQWMQRLAEFRPHLAGAVWRGTATRQSAVHIDLYCDDPKSAELALLDRHPGFDVHTLDLGGNDPRDILTVASRCDALREPVTVHLHVNDLDDLRGALRVDARGRSWRGDFGALKRLLADAVTPGVLK